MGWFSNWFDRRVQNSQMRMANSIGLNDAKVAVSSGRLDRMSQLDRTPSLNFKMHRAETGWIMEVMRYDQKVDRHTTALHLIDDQEDLGESISNIITMETMRA